jgi:hypothetical protein
MTSTRERRTQVLLGHLNPNIRTQPSILSTQPCSGESTLPEPLRVKIFGVGRYLPPHVITSEVIDGLCGLPKGYTEKTSGVKERRYIQSIEKLAQKR